MQWSSLVHSYHAMFRAVLNVSSVILILGKNRDPFLYDSNSSGPAIPSRNPYSTTWNICSIGARYSGVGVPNRFCHHAKSLLKKNEKCFILHFLRTFCVSIAPAVSMYDSCVPFILPSSLVDFLFEIFFLRLWCSFHISFSSSFKVGTTSFRKKLHQNEVNSWKYVVFLRV